MKRPPEKWGGSGVFGIINFNGDGLMIDGLCSYFESKGDFAGLGLHNLSRNYMWPKNGKFPDHSHVFQEELLGESLFAKNIFLKKISPDIWRRYDKLSLANWIVRDWGGIRGNKNETINNYIEEINQSRYPSKIKGVATYSKILSFMDPQNFAIYDARVAISLNAIQLISGVKNGVAFCYLPGRNAALKLFRMEPSTHINALRDRGWQKINSDDCYQMYIRSLKAASKIIGNENLYELEMSLFADAERLSEVYRMTLR
jgi:hypothetical protein